MTTRSSTAEVAASAPWTTRRLLRWMIDHFTERQIDAPRIVAEMLLAHVLGCERLRLYMEADRPASAAERTRLRDLVRRAARHEPVQYLVGEAWFFGRPFHVDRSTLIPRPSTETLVQHVLEAFRPGPPGEARPDLRIADLGTGTGCIAISLAAHLPAARVVATDLSAAALALARRNADRHGVADRIDLREGGLLEPLAGEEGACDVICANPPYISDAEWAEVATNVRDYEPPSALRAGPDGLELIRPLIAGAGRFLRPSGELVVEIGHSQHGAVLSLAAAATDLAEPRILKDGEGLWRVLVARRR